MKFFRMCMKKFVIKIDTFGQKKIMIWGVVLLFTPYKLMSKIELLVSLIRISDISTSTHLFISTIRISEITYSICGYQ